MTWVVKVSLIVCMLFSAMGLTLPATADASELFKVTVTVNIENPTYFWQYPVLGKQLDRISISSFGKTYYLSSSSSSEKLEIDVPQDYRLRLYINLQSNNSNVQSFTYVSNEGVHRNDQNFTITIKAPDPQPAIVLSPDFEISKR